MGNFNFVETEVKDLYIVEPKVYGDERGYFMEFYNQREFKENGLNMTFVQDNESKSKRGVLRGLHFQSKYSQGKLVRVTKGEVFDVAVDLRIGSPTYKKWFGVFLSEENKKSFYIPEGFAHGFLVMSEEAIFNYKCTNFYEPKYDSGLLWNDDEIGIEWPLDQIDEIILSEKDKRQRRFKEMENPFKYGE